MLRISKLADYGTAVMVYLAQHSLEDHNAKDIAAATHVALPTVSKLLKLFARAGLLHSQRGIKGGYRLAMAAEHISVAQIIAVLDGDIAITECGDKAMLCNLHSSCGTRHSWQIINHAIREALEGISLANMARSQTAAKLHIVMPSQLANHFSS